ncbi:MAG: response regulator [Proteobacteria bacterium]|nr:response regulator [Pseudomonadota bacterium]MBU1688047.1 response regulator [Pseudomonadota bacterium]
MDNLNEKQLTITTTLNRVLLVDDEDGFLELMYRMVSSFGYVCQTAKNAEEALVILSRETFNILLTDMMMPGMDGMELLKHCRQHFPDMEVIVLTGYSKIYSYTDVIKRGATDFIEKPVGIDELCAKLQRVSREQDLRSSLRLEIMERIKAEAELQNHQEKLNDIIDQRTHELQRSNALLLAEVDERIMAEQELLSYAERVKLFAYTVSHDLKTPAISINGLAELLLRKYGTPLEERAIHICRQIVKSSEQLVELVENINQYIHAKETPISIESVDPGNILWSIGDEFSEELKKRGIGFSLPDKLPTVRADKLALTRVFWNYIDNALKYGGDTLDVIAITYVDADDYHQFKVSDNGAGIGSDETESIFQLFNRSRAAMAKKGTGMGLAIVREIAEQHKGQAWVERGDPCGTTFCISLNKNL